MVVTREQIVQWLETTAAVMAENKAYLTDLDSPIGDADHGINMDRGFRNVLEKLPEVADKDIGNIFKTKTVFLSLIFKLLLILANSLVLGASKLKSSRIISPSSFALYDNADFLANFLSFLFNLES